MAWIGRINIDLDLAPKKVEELKQLCNEAKTKQKNNELLTTLEKEWLIYFSIVELNGWYTLCLTDYHRVWAEAEEFAIFIHKYLDFVNTPEHSIWLTDEGMYNEAYFIYKDRVELRVVEWVPYKVVWQKEA